MRFVPRSLFVAALAGAALAPSAARADAPTGRLLVLLRGPAAASPAAHASAVRAVIARAGARPSGADVPQIGLVTVRPAPGGSLRTLTAALRRDPAVRSVQPEYRLDLRAAPNDPALTQPETAAGTPPGTPVEWAYQREGLPHLWDVSHGDAAVVGVVDTGADASHPELGGKINAAVDQGGGPGGADSAGHGTHVASLACAATNNGQGIAGAGGNCRLVVERSDLSDSSIADSIVDATNQGAQAVNLSLGDSGGRPPVAAFVSAIDFAIAHGVVVVTAAADEDTGTDQGQPASLVQPAGTGPDLSQNRGLSITSADFFDGPSGGGRGSEISMAAYGSFDTFTGSSGPNGIFAAFPVNGPTQLEMLTIDSSGVHPPCGCRASIGGSSAYAYLQGTSMASPQVAAVAAVIRRLNPDLSPADVVRLLKQTARQPGSSAHFWNPTLGWGILDAGTAVDTARRIDRRPPSSKLRAPKLVRGTRFTLRWSGRDTAAPGLTPSGIRFFDVYASRSGHPYHRVAHTSRKQMTFRGRRGSSYRFFTVATDRAGNREPRHRRADATTRIRR